MLVAKDMHTHEVKFTCHGIFILNEFTKMTTCIYIVVVLLVFQYDGLILYFRLLRYFMETETNVKSIFQ